MERNVTFSLCLAAAMTLVVSASAAAQEVRDTSRAGEDLSWVPGVADDGTIQWGATRASAAQPDAQRRAVAHAFRIEAVELGGLFVVLEDGSRWEVYLPHRTGTATWRAGDHVLIQQAPVRRGAHTYRLQNGERNSVAAVRFAGAGGGMQPQPGTQPAPPGS
jgi:hypothetical protein